MVRTAVMTKYILGMLLLGLFFLPEANGQRVRIELANPDSLCAGYGDQSNAQFRITTDDPFRVPDNAGIVYDWYAVHDQATKRWNTPVKNRVVPMPWAGQYEVWVLVRYVNKETLSPFAAFKSNPLFVNVEACPENRVAMPLEMKEPLKNN